MYLKNLKLIHFRSFSFLEMEFINGINLIYGPNAAGKTNLLEGIHILSNLRSFRTSGISELIQWEAVSASISGEVTTQEGIQKSLTVLLESNRRMALVQGKRSSPKDYLSLFPTVTFSPDDLGIVKGPPSERRSFMDKGIFQLSPTYWADLSDYNQILKQKNALLKHESLEQSSGKSDLEILQVLNEQMQRVGSRIIYARREYLKKLQEALQRVYKHWLSDHEDIQIIYKSTLGKDFLELNLDGIQGLYQTVLQKMEEKELRYQASLVGPHRDDMEIFLNGRPIHAFGSQGQQRTAVLALKLASSEVYVHHHGEYPALILDDVTSELDPSRNERLLEYLKNNFQVFLSSTVKLPYLENMSSCTSFELSP
ncbi:MAG TPA: DNA replication/repair protein RecF [Candidatus Limnocylindrales bacterium]|nr:DNA replication/repair protein RecF [Candidatus Limnocylindrales bacterium]